MDVTRLEHDDAILYSIYIYVYYFLLYIYTYFYDKFGFDLSGKKHVNILDSTCKNCNFVGKINVDPRSVFKEKLRLKPISLIGKTEFPVDKPIQRKKT